MSPMHRYLVAVVVVSIALAAADSKAQDDDLLTRLTSAETKIRIDASQALAAQRQETIQRLMRLVQKKDRYDTFDTTTLAIQALGTLRAVEATDLLASHISMEARIRNAELPTTAEHYPAAGALVQIGSPALPALLRVIVETEDQRSLQLAGWSISEILGRNLAMSYLQQERSKRTGATAQRIKSAQDHVAMCWPTSCDPIPPP